MKVCPHCSGAYPVAEGFCPMDGTRLRTLHASDGGAPIGPGDAYASTLLGTVLDRRYRLDALIGEGGMGLVFRATHVLIGKPLAIKLLRPEHTSSPDVARRFLLEARVASSLKHPNVVEISDFGETGSGGAYYVMELLEGRTLAQSIDQSGPMSPPDAVITAAQICAGLSAAHALGIVHRDLKPDNVFLADPRHGAEHPVVKLLDFGIARAGPRRITVSGSVLGTPEYMSPEMAQGHDVDHRADLYALGVILFEMLTGTVPFYNREMAKTLELHVFGERPSLASRKPELARLQRIGELVGVLMSIDRDARPRDAGEVLRSLRAAWGQDLDAEAAAQVQRATLAIGSNRLPDIVDAARGAPWPAATPAWPEQVVPPAGGPGLGRGPSPEPHSPTFKLPTARPQASGVRPVLIAISTAVIACAITLGIARWLQAPSATPAALEADDASTSGGDERSPVSGPGLAEAVTPAIVRERPPVAVPPIAKVEPTAAPPIPAQDVIPSASTTLEDEEKPGPGVDRSKAKRKRASTDVDVDAPGATGPAPTAPAAGDPATPPPKPAADPPANPRADPGPASPSTSPRPPADLKDPFPTK